MKFVTPIAIMRFNKTNFMLLYTCYIFEDVYCTWQE